MKKMKNFFPNNFSMNNFSLEFFTLLLILITPSISTSKNNELPPEDSPKQSFIRALQNPMNGKFPCTTLRYSYFWIPTASILEPCDDFNRANETKTFLKPNLQDAQCLLYYESFCHLCAAANDMDKQQIQFYANYQQYKKIIKNKESISEVCKHLENVTSITDVSPTFASLLQNLGNIHTCSLLCEELDGSVALLCKISAFMLGVVKDIKNNKFSKKLIIHETQNESYRTFFYIYGSLLGILLILIYAFVRYRKKIISFAYGGQSPRRKRQMAGQYENLVGSADEVVSL